MPKRGLALLPALLLAVPASAAQIISAPYVSPAAEADQAALCYPQVGQYPAQFTWAPSVTLQAPRSATLADNLQPKVEQYRGGQLVATYTTLGGVSSCYQSPMNIPGTFQPQCGPFPRGPYRTWMSGDIFLVYPAVYSGDNNQPWFGPAVDTYAQYLAISGQGSQVTDPAGLASIALLPVTNGQPGPFVPAGITVLGLVLNGIRPVVQLAPGEGAAYNNYNQSAVYFAQSSGLIWDNIDVVAQPGYGGAKAGIYIAGANNLTIADSRVVGFHNPDAMGVFGAEADSTPGATDNNSGTLSLLRLELGYNGGVTSAANHNAYIGASGSDPNFTVLVRNIWSHNVFYGHTFKSRAQRTDVQGSYFEGSTASSAGQADAYLLDIPNGGIATVKDNVFVKNASGANTNGISLTFDMEGNQDGRPMSVDYENNTFVAFSEYFDGSHPLYPMQFFYPGLVPATSGFPANLPVTVKNNAFIGYCPQGNPVMDFRGAVPVTEGFSELTRRYSLTNRKEPLGDRSIIGAPDYQHVAQPNVVRTRATIGAQD